MGDIKQPIILAITPGTRALGIAVFEGLDLLYYGVKEGSKHRAQHTPHSRAREAAATVEGIMHKYQPSYLTISRLSAIQRLSPKLSLIADHIMQLARQRGLDISEYDPAAIRGELCGMRRATKQAASVKLSTLYPELTRRATGTSFWQRLYYARMFAAVTAGYVQAQELLKVQGKAIREAWDRKLLSGKTTNMLA